ncbi:hypothetical protein [Streptomyces sp. NPDC086835]|jgi:hypothetical protein|uniref:hypothetical protein n=1 Tax=Streptomyces sp. NPDC086835 TaxID=3365761 RepID=UPI0037FBC2FE
MAFPEKEPSDVAQAAHAVVKDVEDAGVTPTVRTPTPHSRRRKVRPLPPRRS